MKKFEIMPNDANQRLDKFVLKSTVNLPNALLYKYIRLKRIKVNNKKADAAYRLLPGDIVDMYLNDDFFGERESSFLKAPDKLDVIYEDENILLTDKKPGLVVHEDETGTSDTLIARILHYLYNKGEYDPRKENSFVPALCNRIDRNTGGIVIAAKNAQALRIMNEKIKVREVKKRYLCIVHGLLKKKSDILIAYLEKDTVEKKVYIHKTAGDGRLTVKTKYRVLDERDHLSLLEIELITGRTHQIRAHLASIGHPLLGDGKYGSNLLNKPYGFHHQALYAYQIAFDFITDAGCLNNLRGKVFKINDVWFEREFRNGGIFKKKGP